MFNKKLQKFSIRKLTVGAASVLIGISFVLMRDNNTVHAADMPVATTTVQTSQDKLSTAKSNIDKAQTEVNNAQTKLNDAQSSLTDAQNKANQAGQAYDAQNAKTIAAQKDADSKKQALDNANDKVYDAQKAVDNANKPGVKENAQKNITDKETALTNTQDAEKAAETKANDATQEVTKASQDVKSKQSDVNAKQADKNKADADVKAAQDALKGTGVEEASKALTDANNKVSQDQSSLKNADKAVDQATQDKNKSDKNLADAQTVVNKANKDQQNAQADYDAKKQASDEANKPVVEKQNEKDQLQKQLDDLKDKSKNNIVISDVDRFKQAYAYAMQHDEMMSNEDAAWTKEENSKNHYISSEPDKKELVEPNNLTDAQVEELSLFISDLQSKVRAQLGFGPDQVTKGAMDLAKAVAKRYADDHWNENWHDAVGINDVSKELGLDSNESSDRNVWQYYEDLQQGATWGAETMDELKEAAYNGLLSMILPSRVGNVAPGKSGFEMGHTSGVLNIGYNADKNEITDDLSASPEVNNQYGNAQLNLESYKESLPEYQKLLANGPTESVQIYTGYRKVDNESDDEVNNNSFAVTVNMNTSNNKPSIEVYVDNTWKYITEDKLNSYLTNFIEKCGNKIPTLEQTVEKYEKLAQEDKKNRSIYSATSYSSITTLDPVYDYNCDNGVCTRGEKIRDDKLVQWDVHFLTVNPNNIEDPSKFSTEIIPSYADQIANVTKQLETANQELVALQNEAKSKNYATAQAKQVLDNAQNAVQAAQQALNNAHAANNNAQNLLSKAQKIQAQLQNKLSDDQNDQKAKKAVYDKLTADQKQKADILNASLAAQTKAANALKDAQNALTNAQSKLNDVKQNQAVANNDVVAKKEAIQQAQTALKNAQTYLTNLNNAPEMLAMALNGQKVAQSNYDTAKKNADSEAEQLGKLKQAKDTADDKVKAAQGVVTTAEKNLASAKNDLTNAQNAYTAIEDDIASENAALNNNDLVTSSEEEPMTGVAHIKNTVTLVNGKGEASTQTIDANTDYKVFAKKTINGKTYYRLGTDNQWVIEDAVSAITDGVTNFDNNPEEALNAVGYIPVLKNHPTWKIALVDGNGNYTGQYLPTNSNWKVFAKKTINGQTYYRLGTDQQWIPANFLQVKKNGVVKANPVKNHPTWKIALLNQNGEYTGEFVKPNTSWKVLDVEFINGRMMARIGNQAQWIPMEFVSWVK